MAEIALSSRIRFCGDDMHRLLPQLKRLILSGRNGRPVIDQVKKHRQFLAQQRFRRRDVDRLRLSAMNRSFKWAT
jgi:hypothetical protein